MSQNVLNLLLLELASNDKTSGSIDGTRCTQLGKEVLNRVLGRPMHALANVGDVRKHRLLVAFPSDLGRSNDVSLA